MLQEVTAGAKTQKAETRLICAVEKSMYKRQTAETTSKLERGHIFETHYGLSDK